MTAADSHDGDVPVVAVIGGGASGTLAAAYLLRVAAAARTPLRIALIDRYGRHGRGQAYATTNPAHLLNSPADRMSAVTHDPGHLARWGTANGIEHDGFLPRGAFGHYLCDLLADAERAAGPAATVSRITSDVVALTYAGLDRPLRLHLAADGRIDADVAVLATGNQPPAPPCRVPASPRYIPDPWTPGALAGVADGRPVAILGTGLTMLDVAIAVTNAHPGTVVHAISRHALLPREHRWPGGGTGRPPVLQSLDGGPAGLPGTAGLPSTASLPVLIRHVRAAAAEAGDDWQDVVDALRPSLPRLWQGLSTEDQRLFLRHAARYWEVHRHRVPPTTAWRVRRLQSAGRLRLRRGRVTAVGEGPAGLCIRVEQHRAEQHRADQHRASQNALAADIAAGWLINATGPAADITASRDPLLRGLLGSGLARPDPLRLGIEADAGGAVLDAAGRPSDHLFTLGPPLRGQLYETTAIPEIRDQAAALAARLVMASRVRAASGSAA